MVVPIDIHLTKLICCLTMELGDLVLPSKRKVKTNPWKVKIHCKFKHFKTKMLNGLVSALVDCLIMGYKSRDCTEDITCFSDAIYS